MKMKAIFFDRDDTLIKNIPYLGDPRLVQLMPFAKESLTRLQEKGFLLLIVSNQSGVGRGYITKEQVQAVNNEMIQQLETNFFKEIYCAFSTPNSPEDDGRKPNPKLVLEAAQKYNLDLSKSYFVGDRVSDIECALNAGCHPVLLLSGDYLDEKNEASKKAEFVGKDLREVTDWILDQVESTQ